MTAKKYKYYFRKPKSEIAKDMLKMLIAAGFLVIAAQSPYFVLNLIAAFKKWKKYPKKKVYNTFYQFKRRGLIAVEEKNHQFYISLTSKGKQMAGIYQIDALKIPKPKQWDGKWRILLFDIPEKLRITREAFRGKLRELGFCPLQKSAWIHPYDCETEVELLKDFFGLSKNELRLIITRKIEEDGLFQKYFGLLENTVGKQ